MKYTDNLIPIMTSYTTPSGVVSSSTTENGAAYKAFDRLTNTFWGTNSGWTSGWIQYDFGLGNSKIINKYTILAYGTGAPKSWNFQGSNDGASFVTLDSQSNQTGWTLSTKREFTFENNTKYQIYRLAVTNNNTNGILIVFDIEMMQSLPYEYFLQDGNNLCRSDDGIQLITSDFVPYTKDKFDTYGMSDLSNISSTVISKINNDKYNIGLLKGI